MLTPPRVLTRVPPSLMAGKTLPERVAQLCAIAAPFEEFLSDPLAWRFTGSEFRLETVPLEPEPLET